MGTFLNIAAPAALKAGDLIVRTLDQFNPDRMTPEMGQKVYLELQHSCEQEICSQIHKIFPSHGIQGRSGTLQKGREDVMWMIDPLDAEVNFCQAFPQLAVCIAIREKDRLVESLVFDPIRQELFQATRGRGARLNDHRIRVNSKKSLAGAVLATVFPLARDNLLVGYCETLAALHEQKATIRITGASALELAWVAAGRLDGLWQISMKRFQFNAGSLLIKEAGGLLADFEGGNDFSGKAGIVAASPKILKGLLQVIRPRLAK